MEKDQKILNAIRSGYNDEALELLYNRTLRKVRRYITQNSGDTEEANDIFQDALVIFFHKVKKDMFDPEQSIDGYIYTIARNLWITKTRREQRMKRYREYIEKTEEDVMPDHMTHIMNREKSSTMNKVFLQLDENCQKLLKLAVFDRLSMKEISLRMGHKNEHVSKAQHYRCKQYLSKLVKGNREILEILGS